MSDKRELGEKIKHCRLERNLTLKEVERKAKVSATHVSEIERGMTSPTVGALAKIAKALGTEPSYFLRSDDTASISVVRRSKKRVLTDSAWGADLGQLSHGIKGSEMSLLEINLGPGRFEAAEPLTHPGEEFMFILSGVVELSLGLTPHVLKEGDSIHFRSSEPSTLRNNGDSHARLLWIALPPLSL